MACSEAQLVANRANARRSTGPSTEAGRASSRWNARTHGLAGRDDLFGPDDAATVEARARAFGAQLQAPGPVGVELAHRAAVLSLRLRAATENRRVVEDAFARTARERFDADRLDQLAEWSAALAGPNPIAALDGLETSPEGLDDLIPAWERLRARVAAGEPEALDQAARWLVLRDHERDHLLGRVDAELARLRRRAADPAPLLAGLAARRAEAGVLANYDPAPELIRAYRYEVAAERGFFRALSEIRALRRQADHSSSAPKPDAHLDPDLPDLATLLREVATLTTPEPDPAPPPPAPEPAPARAPIPAPGMGSFRITEPMTLGAPTGAAWDALMQPSLEPIPTRRPRPDLRKLAKKRR